MEYIWVIPISYILGSIPTGLILVRYLKNTDVREYGSGKIGTTNVQRTAGTSTALVVLVVDMGKGAIATLLATLVSESLVAPSVAGVMAVIGHNWPIFVGFKGGRGVATGAGSMIILAPWVALLTITSFVIVAGLSRYASLGSLAAVAVAIVGLLITGALGIYNIQHSVFGLVAGPLIIARHWDNIRRLRKGTERRLGTKAEPKNIPTDKDRN